MVSIVWGLTGIISILSPCFNLFNFFLCSDLRAKVIIPKNQRLIFDEKKPQ